jgi:predicted nucleic acid-binding protein
VTRANTAFVDTSVLVAALDANHPQHGPCLALLSSLKAGAAFCALHSYAEFYAVMSAKPGKPRLRPQDVDAMLGRVDQLFTPIALSRREYRQAISDCASRGNSGGRLYDALIAACAQKCAADHIYTLNHADFTAVLPAAVHARIRRP